MTNTEQSTAPVLTKAQLMELLQEEVALNKRESLEIVDAFFGLIAKHLVAADDVKLLGFGNFQVRDKPPRPGRNPRTKEPAPIRARRVVTFHASSKLKELVQARAVAP